jgi:hypothetical protein
VNVVIFHDCFGAIGGGERVVLEMAKILNADIITTDPDAVTKLDYLSPCHQYRKNRKNGVR